jgi:hypothetical protein
MLTGVRASMALRALRSSDIPSILDSLASAMLAGKG